MSSLINVVGTAQGHVDEIERQSEQSVRDVVSTRVLTGERGDELGVGAAYGGYQISGWILALGKCTMDKPVLYMVCILAAGKMVIFPGVNVSLTKRAPFSAMK